MKIYPEPTLQKEFLILLSLQSPEAIAHIMGYGVSKELHGIAYFYSVPQGGTLVEMEVFNLPHKTDNKSSYYGMHIHEYGNCIPPFNNTGNHYNPTNLNHPNHLGDLPPLLGNDGYAYSVFYTSRINVNDIIGKSLVIHSNPDDFTTQPSGNSGTKIGCGIIFSPQHN